MSDSTNPPPNRRERISRDADTISGFFGTRAGVIITVSIVVAVITFSVLGAVFGW